MRIPVATEPGVLPGITPSARFDAPKVSNAGIEQVQELGGAVQKGAQAFATVQTDILKEAKARIDRPIFDDAVTKGLRLQMELESGDAGFVHAKGVDALVRKSGKPLGAEYDEVYAERLQEIRDSLPNDDVKNAFDQQIPAMRRSLLQRVDAHMVKQQDAYDVSVQQGKAEVGGKLMVDHFDDPERWAMGRAGVADAVRQLNKGMDQDAVSGEVRKAMTPLHQQIIQRMVDTGNVMGARDYFARPDVMADLTEEAKTRVSGALTVAATEIEGQQAARDVVTGMGDAWSLKQADEALVAKLGSNPKALQEARQELSHMNDLRRDAKAVEKDALLEPLQKLKGDADSAGRIITDAERRAVLSPLRLSRPDLYAQGAESIAAHNEQIRSRNEAAIKLADGLSSGERGANAINLKFDMLSNPDNYRNADMGKVIAPLVREGKITAEAGNGLLGMWEKLRKGEGEQEMASFGTAVSLMNDMLAGSYISKGKGDTPKKFSELGKDEQAALKAKMRASIDGALQAMQRMEGRKYGKEDIKRVVQDAFRSTTQKGWWGSSEPITVADPEGAAARATNRRVDEEYAAIPAATLSIITAALKKNGQPVTKSNIIRYYKSIGN